MEHTLKHANDSASEEMVPVVLGEEDLDKVGGAFTDDGTTLS